MSERHDLCGDGRCPHCANTIKPFKDQDGVVHYNGTPPTGPVKDIRPIVKHSSADLRKVGRRER